MKALSAWLRTAAGALPVLFVLTVNGAAVRAATPDDGAARSVVEGFHATLLQVMKTAKAMGIKGRYAVLAPEVARRFNLRLMIAIATGPSWPKASKAERDSLTDAFGRFSAASYAANFKSFSGESFSTVSVAPGPRGTMVVSTRINQPNESPVRLVYVTRPAGGKWQIVDVLVDDGISQLAIHRSEYRSVLGSQGVAGLVAELNRKADQLLEK